MGKFQKGQPRPANAGRKRGSRNKITRLLKEAFVLAAEKVGDPRNGGRGGLVGYLSWVAAERSDHYLAQLGKLVPHEVEVGLKADIRHRTLAEIDDDLEDLGFPIEEIASLLIEARSVDGEAEPDEESNDRPEKQVANADAENEGRGEDSEASNGEESNNEKSEGEQE